MSAIPSSPQGHDSCCCGNEHLTYREIEVLILLAADHTTLQIAAKLCISARTVEGHIASMMRRSRTSSRAGLLARTYDAAILIPLPRRWSGRRCLPWASGTVTQPVLGASPILKAPISTEQVTGLITSFEVSPQPGDKTAI
jgi:DNA-binding CsgD family transcriptional regulator